jgi:photosystem II stability/assembly factor-like uncharacterized protein
MNLQKHLIFFLLFLSNPAFSQWNIREKWGGEPAYDVKSQGGVLFAATYGGLYRSTNDGINWTKIESIGPANAFYEVEITENGTIYCTSLGADYELERSSDGGLSWQKILAPPGNFMSDLQQGGMAVVGNWLFMRNGKQVFRLSDTGTNFEPILTLPFSGDLYSLKAFDGVLWVGTQAGAAFYSTDSGQTWQQINAGAPFLAIKGNVVLNYADPIYQNTYITRSTNNGQTWTQVTMPEIIKSIYPSENFFWAQTYSNQILKSADGLNWTVIGTAVDPNYWSGVQEINGSFFLPSEAGIRRSTDGGSHWWANNTGIGGSAYPLQSIGKTLLAGKRNFSDNGGESWKTMIKPGSYGHLYTFDDRIYITSDDNLWRCVDGDLSQWELIVPAAAFGAKYSQGFFKAGNWLFSTNNLFSDLGKVYRSSDEGLSWEICSDVDDDFNLIGTIGDSTVIGQEYSSTGANLLISRDLGLSWQIWDVAPQIGYNNFNFRVDGEKIYTLSRSATENPNLLLSEDYGLTWRKLSENILSPAQLGIYGFYDFAVKDSLLFAYTQHWVGYDGALWMSRDTGNTWTNLLAHPDFSNVLVTSLGVTSEHLFFINQADGKLWIRSLSSLSEKSQAGLVFWDLNLDQVQQSDEFGVKYCGIKTSNPQSFAAIASENGGFLLDYISQGDTVRPVVPALPYTVSVPAFRLGETGNPLMRFAIQRPDGIHDLRLEAVPASDFLGGRNTNVHFFLSNDGTETESGILEVIFNEHLTVEGATPNYSSLQGNQLKWTFSALKPLEQRQFICNVKSGVGSQVLMAGLTAHAQILNDTTPLNNADTLFTEILNSYDPNDKQVDRPTLTVPEAAQIPELQYKIRFQNTGNYPAFEVRLLDTLSTMLDVSSLRMIGASHPFRLQLTGNNILEFIFENIMLPDSMRDEQGSHGFVAFGIRPNRVLQLGEILPNTAHIFFDFNPPITTNTATTEVVLPLGVRVPTIQSLQIFPNPASREVFVRLPESETGASFLDVYSFDGRLQQLIPTDGRSAWLSFPDMPPGIYLLSWRMDNGGRAVGKLVWDPERR